MTMVAPVGVAHAPSPDVRVRPPGFRSLGAGCAPAGTDPPQADWSLPSRVSHAGSWGMGNPALTGVAQEWFVREAHV